MLQQAFTIYTFFQLLINFLGGERSLIVMMHGRPPKRHPWPLSHVLSKVDISDPHTFLAVKRGILQYAYLKPILSVATIVMKLTNTYQEGYLGLTSGYLWSGILYNVSVTLSLYSLAMFWVCMSQDLKPFRPVPKFLCIKLIIFASYWQGFFLSILQLAGAIPNGVQGYTADNPAAAIQDALICIEMPIFAISHWYAFSWKDYADVTISSARMPVRFAVRDAFGGRDLIEDAKETFTGKHYEYRVFDSGDNVMTHEESSSRAARMSQGMRYGRDGKGKYWIPTPGEVNSRTPLLGNTINQDRSANFVDRKHGSMENGGNVEEVENTNLDAEDERLYSSAHALEFGDWNYPVITAHVPATDRWFGSDPNIVTTSTNRNILQPTKGNKARRESQIHKQYGKGKHRDSSPSAAARAPVMDNLIREDSQSSGQSSKSGRSQLVDLVVEDHAAEETERVRARKEGGAAWNEDETKFFVRTYDDHDREDFVREGYDPIRDASAPGQSEFAIDDESASSGSGKHGHGHDRQPEEAAHWDRHTGTTERSTSPPGGKTKYGSLGDANVWDAPGKGR